MFSYACFKVYLHVHSLSNVVDSAKYAVVLFHTALTVIWNVVVYFFTHSISQAIF